MSVAGGYRVCRWGYHDTSEFHGAGAPDCSTLDRRDPDCWKSDRRDYCIVLPHSSSYRSPEFHLLLLCSHGGISSICERKVEWGRGSRFILGVHHWAGFAFGPWCPVDHYLIIFLQTNAYLKCMCFQFSQDSFVVCKYLMMHNSDRKWQCLLFCTRTG